MGTPCPEGEWPDEATIRAHAPGYEGRIIYVVSGATGVGTGARTDPYGQLNRGLSGASPGDIVALSTGTFDDAAFMRSEVALVGACVSGTVIAPTTEADAAVSVSSSTRSARVFIVPQWVMPRPPSNIADAGISSLRLSFRSS